MQQPEGLEARPENSTTPALFDDETETQSKHPGQVAGDATLPGLLPSIVVPRDGIDEKTLFERLGLQSSEVYPLLGRDLEYPHDCRYASRPAYAAHYFSADGVRKLVDHFRIRIDVREESNPLTAPARPRYVFWWEKEGLQ